MTELYSATVRLQLDQIMSRGRSTAEHIHYYTASGNLTAALAGADIAEAVRSGGIGSRWSHVVRGPVAHEVVVERRTTANRRLRERIATHAFALPERETFSGTLPIPGASVDISGAGEIVEARGSARSAVLVIRSGNGITSRCYVGPISSTYLAFQVSDIGGVPFPGIFMSGLPDPTNGDYPPLPGDSGVEDTWRTDIRDLARDYVGDLRSRAGGAEMVVVSWKTGSIAPISRVAASTVVAELRSRGVRAPLGPAI